MAAKLRPASTALEVDVHAHAQSVIRFVPAQSITREVKGLLVTIDGDGHILLREKGRRLTVGPFEIAQLYQEGIQRQAGKAPIKPRKATKSVSRGLLKTGDGK